MTQTDSGWQTGESFYNFVTMHLDKELKERNIKRPIMYFVDGHTSHLTYRLRKWCRANGIILICFYPNSTHILQMCDTSMFGPLKSGWIDEIQKWKVKTGNKEVDEIAFVQLLKQVNDRCIKKSSIINGFASTGMFPLNKDNIHYERCLGDNYISNERDVQEKDSGSSELFPVANVLENQQFVSLVVKNFEKIPTPHNMYKKNCESHLIELI